MLYQTLVIFRACYGAARITEFETMTMHLYPELLVDWRWDDVNRLYYGGDFGPSVIQRLPSVLRPDQWSEVATRCIGCRGVFQIVGEGSDLNSCIEHVGRLSDEDVLRLIHDSWSMQIKLIGRSERLHPTERRRRIEAFRDVLKALEYRKVQLNKPSCELILLEDHRREQHNVEVMDTFEAQYVWLLLKVRLPNTQSAKNLAERSDVKKRAFIHTTTMASDRALLMAHLGNVGPNTKVLDPFCGSGGLLLACSLIGASCVGGDIDVDLLNHQNKPVGSPASSGRINRGVEKVSYKDSFIELGLEPPILLKGADITEDSSVNSYLSANNGLMYDAIVTDPPYGIRETQSQLNSDELFVRLCAVAQKVLKTQGRLVVLQILEGRAEVIGSEQEDHGFRFQQMAKPYGLLVESISIEQFNNSRCRATIVMVVS